MAVKVMVFIDGSWFYHSRQQLFEARGEDSFEIDYKRLPVIVADAVSESLDRDVDLVRTCYFGTLPVNKPGYNPSKQRVFYDFLAGQCGFMMEVIPIDHWVEQNLPDDRSVGVALATAAMHFAMMPGAYDVASIVGGNFEYKSLLRGLRRLGKRTHLMTISNSEERVSCSPSLLTDPDLLDLPPLFLDEHVSDLHLVRRERLRACKLCGAEESTTWAGAEFFCAECRLDHRRRVRICDTCGREEETTWDKNYFYCTECRKEYRQSRPADEGENEDAGNDEEGVD